jgi:hypothetical protein
VGDEVDMCEARAWIGLGWVNIVGLVDRGVSIGIGSDTERGGDMEYVCRAGVNFAFGADVSNLGGGDEDRGVCVDVGGDPGGDVGGELGGDGDIRGCGSMVKGGTDEEVNNGGGVEGGIVLAVERERP